MKPGAFLSVLVCSFQVTGLYEYKVFGELASCSPELCADVYMDLTYRKDWDKYAKGKNEALLSVPAAVSPSVCLKQTQIALLVASVHVSRILQVKRWNFPSVVGPRSSH